MDGASTVIEKQQATELIKKIEDLRVRRLVTVVVEGAVQFFDEDPVRLQSPFDLGFFAEVLEEDAHSIAGVVLGTKPFGYWGNEPPEPMVVDPTRDNSPTALRRT